MEVVLYSLLLMLFLGSGFSFYVNDWIKFEANPFLYHSQVLVSFSTLHRVIVCISVITGLSIYYNVCHVLYYLVILAPIIIFFPYLMKSSQFINCCSSNSRNRGNSDILMTTSLIYFLGSLVALFHYYDFEYSFLCIVTTIGSLCYHLYREARFFNFDNIFATPHFFVYLYTLADSQDKLFLYFSFGLCTFPIAFFALAYCGLPSEIKQLSEDVQSRNSRDVYDTWHTVWHLSSGCGPILSSYYLHNYYDAENNIGSIKELPTIYLLSIILSLSINLLANFLGIVPLP
jgi:hypothetical protein